MKILKNYREIDERIYTICFCQNLGAYTYDIFLNEFLRSVVILIETDSYGEKNTLKIDVSNSIKKNLRLFSAIFDISP